MKEQKAYFTCIFECGNYVNIIKVTKIDSRKFFFEFMKFFLRNINIALKIYDSYDGNS